MSETPIPRAVELVATLLIPRKKEDLETIRNGIVNTDGRVSGPRLNGRVTTAHVTGNLSENGRLAVVANIRILTDDRADVLMINRGEWWGSNEALQRLIADELVTPGEIYLIGVVRFETVDPRYAWLSDGQYFSHAVGENHRIKVSVYRAAGAA
jgi:hypothetical protein